MSTAHDPYRTRYIRQPADNTIAARNYKRASDVTMASPDQTIASAWALSPLGDPAGRSGYYSDRPNIAAGPSWSGGVRSDDEYEPERSGSPAPQGSQAARRLSMQKAAIAAAVLVGAVGGGAALALTLVSSTHSTQPSPASVI